MTFLAAAYRTEPSPLNVQNVGKILCLSTLNWGLAIWPINCLWQCSQNSDFNGHTDLLQSQKIRQPLLFRMKVWNKYLDTY